MYVCMYVCIVGLCAYVYVRMYVNSLQVSICLCVYMYECMHACMYLCMHYVGSTFFLHLCRPISRFTVQGAHVHWVGSTDSPMWQGELFLSQPVTTLEDGPITEESL